LWLDDNAQPQFEIHYLLIADYYQTTKWCFSNSFPGLPIKVTPSLLGTNEVTVLPFLDDLDFTTAAFVVRSCAVDSEDLGFVEGVNFSGQIRPLGVLGILQNLLPVKIEPVDISGPIHYLADDTRMDMTQLNVEVGQVQVFPWEIDDYEVPGIHLNVKLPLSFSLGKAKVEQTYLRLYAPITPQLDETANLFSMTTALTARLNIPSADITMDMVCDLRAAL
jgi:hypothetical protein